MHNRKEKTTFGFVNNKHDISEKFLHYLWKNKLFDTENLIDNSGNKIEIISVGTHNNDAGPDFFNAKIKLKNTVWAGNIEIHTDASDWFKHNHHKDKAYNNVILQVVLNPDKETYTQNNRKIPTAVISFDQKLKTKYLELTENKNDIKCKSFIPKTDKFLLNLWLTNLLTERALQKTENFRTLLKTQKNNWEEVFYIITAKSFGFKTNSLPFEMLAKSLPLKILAKHKNNKFQIEALLFGQAGMLNDNIPDDYFVKLKKEYDFLKKKYELVSVEKHIWKFLRIRPSNFPTLRIAQFADLINKSSHLFSKILEAENIPELEKMFDVKASQYWNTHYNFGKKSNFKEKKLGKTAVSNIIINTVIPTYFLYGKEKDDEQITGKAITFLENLKPEKNNIVKKWENAGIKVKNAYFSQSLIQLYNEYCLKNRCTECRIGNLYIKNK